MISVLLVHDGSELPTLIKTSIEKMGDLRVDAVSSPKQAIDTLRGRSYDLIISYSHIPLVDGIEFFAEMDGIEFLKYIRNQGVSIPFLLYGMGGGDRIVLQDLNAGTEVPIKGGQGARVLQTDLQDMVRRAVLRKRAEREQIARLDLLNTILSSTPFPIVHVMNRVITWINRPMALLLGYEPGELAGKGLATIISPADDIARLWGEAALRNDRDGWGHAEASLISKGGGTVHVQVKIRPADAKDSTKGEILMVEDRTEVDALREALMTSDLRYRDLLAETSSIIIKTTPTGEITFFNRTAQAFFGYSSAEVVGKNVVETILPATAHPPGSPADISHESSCEGEGHMLRITENIVRNGEHVWIAWFDRAIFSGNGEISEIVSVGHDITDHGSPDRVRISTTAWRDVVIAGTDIKDTVFDAVFHTAYEISREGREGKQIGAAFVIGDAENVLARSNQLILNPLEGHPHASRMITGSDIKENVKELAQLDGAFVVAGDGLIIAAARLLTVDANTIGIPKGHGSRHSAVAGITQVTRAVGVVVSQSGGRISIFKNGKILKEIA